MTNWDKNLEKILEIIRSGEVVAVDKKGKTTICRNFDCDECIFFSSDYHCAHLRKDWFNKEVDPYENWESDKKILVSDDGKQWYRRHFARAYDGKCYAWNDGSTSYSASYNGDIVAWKYAKPYEEE